MEAMKTKLTEMHTPCPTLAVGCCWLSVILQTSNFEAILYLGHFFLYTLYYCARMRVAYWALNYEFYSGYICSLIILRVFLFYCGMHALRYARNYI